MDEKIFENGWVGGHDWESVGGRSEWATEENQMEYYMVSESE